jgi:hypothetical protein
LLRDRRRARMQTRAAAAGENDSFAFHMLKLAVFSVQYSAKTKNQTEATRPQ